MRTILLAGVIALAPFVAFAHGPQQAQGKLTFTGAGSLAGVQSTQGTSAASNVAGNGFVVNGAVSGNYTDVTTKGAANLGKNAAKTNAAATQVNIGGTVTGGLPKATPTAPRPAGRTARRSVAPPRSAATSPVR